MHRYLLFGSFIWILLLFPASGVTAQDSGWGEKAQGQDTKEVFDELPPYMSVLLPWGCRQEFSIAGKEFFLCEPLIIQ